MSTQDKSFYVYALKDPRTTPAKPFYIGKGTALRIFEHVQNIDNSAKGCVIQEILADGKSVLETKLVESLTESEALRIEAELISASKMLRESLAPLMELWSVVSDRRIRG